MNISVQDKSTFFDLVFVNTGKGECDCDLDTMSPNMAINLPTDNCIVCWVCMGIVGWRKNEMYDIVHGYSGYDEDNDQKYTDED